MINKKTLIGCAAGGVTYFLLGWLIYGILLKDFYASQTTVSGFEKNPPDFLFLIIGNLSSALLMAIILGNWLKVNSVAEGFKAALLIGCLLGIGFDSVMYATTNMMTLSGVITDILVTTIMTGIGGAVITAAMGMKEKVAVAA